MEKHLNKENGNCK